MNILKNDILSADKLLGAKQFVVEKLSVSRESFKSSFPASASVGNVYPSVKNEEGWTQGFWTGILWLAYELSGDESFREIAQIQIDLFEKRIKEMIGVDHHDM